MAEPLIEAVPQDRVRRVPWLPLAWEQQADGSWLPPYTHGLANIDIGCASVADNHFNRCKTPIKVWEYTAAGAACVVSPTLYGPYVTDGEDALVAETAEEWTNALSRLVEDELLRKRLWRNQRRRVAEHHSLRKNVHRWPAAWGELIDAYRRRQAGRLLLAS